MGIAQTQDQGPGLLNVHSQLGFWMQPATSTQISISEEQKEPGSCRVTISTWDSGHHQPIQVLTLMILNTRHKTHADKKPD